MRWTCRRGGRGYTDIYTILGKKLIGYHPHTKFSLEVADCRWITHNNYLIMKKLNWPDSSTLKDLLSCECCWLYFPVQNPILEIHVVPRLNSSIVSSYFTLYPLYCSGFHTYFFSVCSVRCHRIIFWSFEAIPIQFGLDGD